MESVCDALCLLYLKMNDNITLSEKWITALKIIGSFIQLQSQQQQQILGQNIACLFLFP